ncbi:hypothetical protein [Confluentibacter citreus]|uniref:hypothetical protein n=1 Tax=Confluentibacter citreus TaxID=2007307 RepID=UPI000C28B11B|nr:hypothetical protein [Confluentibacter citreus]
MSIFNFKTSTKNIKEFQQKLAESLPAEFSAYKNIVKEHASYYSIVFSHKPEGITIMYGYPPDFYKKYHNEDRKHFKLFGVYIKRKQNDEYVEMPMTFAHGNLQKIIVNNPTKFHKIFDFNSIELRDIKTENIKIENPDLKIILKILESLSKNQLSMLDLDDSFELEYEEKLYYPILNMEDGNYIAVDKKGKVYRLNHDHYTQIRKIAENPIQFFQLYNGQKSDLENIMNK